MTLKRFLLFTIIAFVVLNALSAFFHEVLLGEFYAQRFAGIGREPIALLPLILNYALRSLALAYFLPATSGGGNPWFEGAWKGALFMLAAAGSGNMAMHALIANWDLTVAVTDTLFEALQGALIGALILALDRRVGKTV